MFKAKDLVSVVDGFGELELASWSDFSTVVMNGLNSHRPYIWRGQKNGEWELESGLDRMLKLIGSEGDRSIRTTHLNRFKRAVLGKRGTNPRELEKNDEYWALGQHHGLYTPLLDWTASPFAAAFFAFVDLDTDATRSAIYGLNREEVETKNDALRKEYVDDQNKPTLELVQPMSDENTRLVSQAGLFTRTPNGKSVEEWVRLNFRGYTSPVLCKLTVPRTEREAALLGLNRMNINHMTLFPDLYGASRFCNQTLVIKDY